jgi:hypothetical protein
VDQGTNGWSTASAQVALTPEVKQAIADEVKAQLARSRHKREWRVRRWSSASACPPMPRSSAGARSGQAHLCRGQRSLRRGERAGMRADRG